MKLVANNFKWLPGLKQTLTGLLVTHFVKVEGYEKKVLVDYDNKQQYTKSIFVRFPKQLEEFLVEKLFKGSIWLSTAIIRPLTAKFPLQPGWEALQQVDPVSSCVTK